MTKEIVSKIKSLYQKSKQLKTENNELKKQLNYSIYSSSIPPAPSSDEGMDLADISISSTSSSSIPTSHNKSISSSTMKLKNNRTSKIPAPSPSSSSIHKRSTPLVRNNKKVVYY